MLFSSSLRSALLKAFVLPASLVAAGLLGGCGMGSSSVSGPVVTSLHVAGVVHGGMNPVSGSTVALWVAGSGSYGAAATNLFGSNVVTTGSDGSFSFTASEFTCPSASSLLYMTASGGNPGLAPGTDNNALKLATIIGRCGSFSHVNNIAINEVTTAATAYALAQYFTTTFGASSTDSFGAPSTTQAQTGIANAFATASNLASMTTGNAVTTLTLTNSVGTVTVTPESAKLNTIANVLAACVNSTGASSSGCTTLLGDTYPTGGTEATDTLQAAVDLNLNPTSNNDGGTGTNMTALYTLQTAQSPFVGVGTQPTDWTVGVTYGSNTVVAGAGIYLLNYPTYLAADASGNIWVENDLSTTATTGNSVTELSPTGSPTAQVLTTNLIGPAGIAIDPTGNVWVPNYGKSTGLQTSVVEYTTAAAVNTFTVNEGPQRIAIDGSGNVFVLEPSYKGLGDLEEISAGATSGSATTLATGLTTDFSNLAIDGNYTVWVTGGGTGALNGTSGYPYVYQFLYSAGSPAYASTPNATINAGGITEPEQALSIDSNNNVFIQNYGAKTVSEISGTSSVSGNASSPFTETASLTKPEFQIMDGAGNLWVTNAVSPGGPVFEISNAGVTLSPSGFAHTYDEPYGIAIDPSGNVWLANYNAAASATVQSYVTEIVGAAAPVVTPLAAGLPTAPGVGTNRLGTRP